MTKLWERPAWDVGREAAVLAVALSLYVSAYRHRCPVIALIATAILIQHTLPLLTDSDGFLTPQMVLFGAALLAIMGAYRRAPGVLFAGIYSLSSKYAYPGVSFPSTMHREIFKFVVAVAIWIGVWLAIRAASSKADRRSIRLPLLALPSPLYAQLPTYRKSHSDHIV